MQAGMVLELLDLFQEYVPASKKAQAAQDIVRVFVEQGADLRWFDEILGEDDVLDTAINTVLEIEEEPQDDAEWEE
jgi:hypothetical protein